MAIHEIAQAFPNGATTADAIRQKLAAATAYTLADPDDIEDIDFTAIDAVALPRYVIANGTLFEHDPLDETSEHDGVTTLVSQDGQRFKSQISPGAFVSVLSIGDSPPISPVVGDKYVVGQAPTGDWAANANDLAVLTSRGWEFAAPEVGQRVYVRSVPEYRYWSEAGVWTQDSLSDGSVQARHQQFPFGMPVESETDTPPGGTPAEGTKWIVAANATGPWDDWDGDIAESDGAGGFVRHSAYDGATVFDKALRVNRTFEAGTGAWITAGGALVAFKPSFKEAGETTFVGSGSIYSFSTSSPPGNVGRRLVDSIVHKVRKSGAVLRFQYDAYFTIGVSGDAGGDSGDHVVAIYRDSETDAVAWQKLASRDGLSLQHFNALLHVQASDANEHTYTVAITQVRVSNNLHRPLAHRAFFSLEEFA